MTPKEKAEELFDKYYIICQEFTEEIQCSIQAKKCALISVDECIESTKQLIHHYTKGDDERYASIYLSMSLSVQYWNEVKREIKKL
jgi:hypothetical protein